MGRTPESSAKFNVSSSRLMFPMPSLEYLRFEL